ncbi:NAD(P)H:quinone oxidoreductase [Effusibacillus lacus]|uniref:NAD(P)H:quinone oxidoreductase type IV n=1 Tax=Effusibacillus lacus TaxID=1348429 RepID=A0A292YR10_9BACL|nr:NAD(P)H:quinone oxidoreductase [Effusibacillus lacus]TCS74957.1 NAD(P)H dehydrogenase (quinone) [Effusibacillus lacus]GAX91626.1 NAD(P)H:quinone oxidoreductase type IV [Effusibacillus lacus]
MSNVKLAILYYSSTGTNYKLAQTAAEAAKGTGAEVKVLRIQELAPESAIAANPAWKAHYEATKDVPVATLEDLEWADAYIFSMPTRFGNVPSQVKQFLDMTGGLWFQGKLANKVVSAMATASNPHGGQEQTILSFYTTMFHWGAIIAAPGYTDQSIFAAGGNPYGTSVTAREDGQIPDEALEAVRHQAKRTVQVAQWVKQGLQG